MLRQLYSRHASSLFAGILLFVVAAPVTEATNPPPDPALVLHYSFDKNAGETARDRSIYGNDGKIIKAKYLTEHDGRQGVLRFDGEQSVLRCPDSDSLSFGGDMSFEIVVRLNAPSKPGMLFGDRSNFGFYVGYWNVLNLAYTNFDSELSANESINTPVTRRIIGDRWSHIAVVIAHPRIRFYHNGELVRDAYMPIPFQKRHKNATSRIGGFKDRHAPIDLDEFRLYRRALTATEIAAHARGEQIDLNPVHELAVEPLWFEDALVMRLSCLGTDLTNHSAEMVLLDGSEDPVVTAQKVDITEAFAGSGRYVASARWPLKNLKGRFLDGVARIHGPDGSLVQTVYRHVFLKKPQWVHSPEGNSDQVPAPWTPIRTDREPGGNVEVGVWGRRYAFGSTPFCQSIETGGAEILASPMALTGQANGESMIWQNGRTAIEQTSETSLSLIQTAENDQATVHVKATVHFDGYAVFDCRIQARRQLSVQKLTLDIPLRAHYATLCQAIGVYPDDPDIPMKRHFGGAVRDDLAFRFSPSIWLGDEQRGLCWQAESDQDWHRANGQKSIEILPRGDVTTFRANLVDVPTPLAAGDALDYKFALLATPSKPIERDSWDLRIARCEPYGRSLSAPDEAVRGKPAIQFYREMGIRHLFTTECDMWPYPLPVHERYSRYLHRLNRELHGVGIKHINYQIHERFPPGAPEFDLHGLHMLNRPLKPYSPGPSSPEGTPRPGPVGMDYGADSQATMMYCPQSQALQDAYVHALARRMDIYGDDGVYLDGTGGINACRNTLHGCGYRAKDGAIRTTYPVFANHQFMKRIYTAVKQRRPDAVVDVHQSYDINPAALTFADMLWTGEHWFHLRHTGAKDHYISAELSLDMFRAEFMGYPLGVAAETLAYRLGPAMKVAAISLLHDIPVRPSTPKFDGVWQLNPHDNTYFDTMTKIWKVRDNFKAQQTQKLFYWNNQDYVRVTPGNCHATLLRHPDNGVLAFITNLRRDPTTVTLQFNLGSLGLGGKQLDVLDTLTDKPVTLTPQGDLSIALSSEQWTYVWLRPKSVVK